METLMFILIGRSQVLSFTTHVGSSKSQKQGAGRTETHSRHKEGRRDYFATDVDYYESM
jgi:hypothetical protein